MIVIPKGEFLMGSTTEQTDRDLAKVTSGTGPDSLWALFGWTDHQRAARWMSYEHPQHRVAIPREFALGIYSVTVAEYGAFVRATNYHTGTCNLLVSGRPQAPLHDAWDAPNFKEDPLDPVVCVTWQDAQAYVRWLNRKLDLQQDGSAGPYRLPSEAEWEYAARAGTQTAYYWGDDVGVNNALCNGCNDRSISGNAVRDRDYPVAYLHRTMRVGPFWSNRFGLYDMLGNAGQWIEDCWHESYSGAPADGSPWLTDNCKRRVQRGGGWPALPWVLRVTSRDGQAIEDAANYLGFRIAKDVK